MHPTPSSAQTQTTTPAFVLALALLGAACLGGWQVLRLAQDAPSTIVAAAATESKPIYDPSDTPIVVENTEGPGWEKLNTEQKLALYPLAERWSLLGEQQKKRWLALAQTFHSLPAEEQAKLHSRMTEWASLSTQQRNQARLNYTNTQRLAPTDKRAQWEAYQALSEEERRQLAAGAAKPPEGAALAIKPAASHKLAHVPAATESDPLRANPPKIPPSTATRTPRIAVPVPLPAAPPAPTAPPAPPPEAQMPAPASVVETAPVTTPQAMPAALPPMSAGSESPAVKPPVTPDNSGLYPQ